jgi:hypothetical protein
MSQRRSLPQPHHYIYVSIEPPTPDLLTLRKLVQDATTAASGLVHASHIDVLWLAAAGDHAVLRTDPTYVPLSLSIPPPYVFFCARPSHRARARGLRRACIALPRSHVHPSEARELADNAAARIDREAQRIMAAIALTPLGASPSSSRLSVLRESPFLPSLLAVGADL